jgi:hypothetical protein
LQRLAKFAYPKLEIRSDILYIISLLRLSAIIETRITDKKLTAIYTSIVFIIFDFLNIELNIIDNEIEVMYEIVVEKVMPSKSMTNGLYTPILEKPPTPHIETIYKSASLATNVTYEIIGKTIIHTKSIETNFSNVLAGNIA